MEHSSEDWGQLPFFSFVGLYGLWPNASLEALSRLPASDGPYATDMVRRVEEAWRTPLRQLDCEQVRLLVGQRMGLQWLARPVLEFAELYPDACITNYQGELVTHILRATEEIHAAAPVEFRKWLKGDFDWIDLQFAWDAELLRSVRSSLAEARQRFG